MIEIRQVTTENELNQILELARLNLRTKLDDQTRREQGFITVAYTLEQLRQMHDAEPSILAVDGDTLAGYALVMPAAMGKLAQELWPMIEQLQQLPYKEGKLSDYRFYLMGQVCVAEAYRGLGVFDKLYEGHRRFLSGRYQLCVTEISTSNTRSLRAHERVGFETIAVYRDAIDEWAVVVWDWS